MAGMVAVRGRPECGRLSSYVSPFAETNSLAPATDGVPIGCTTAIHRTQTFVNVHNNVFLRNG